jgi:hypothetical protein
MRALVIAAALTFAALAADARPYVRQAPGWNPYHPRFVMAMACDRVSGRCIWTRRYFSNPVWR